jgi:hypothetical protein
MLVAVDVDRWKVVLNNIAFHFEYPASKNALISIKHFFNINFEMPQAANARHSIVCGPASGSAFPNSPGLASHAVSTKQ